MKLIRRLFGNLPSGTPKAVTSRLALATREQTRRELIAMALRDTLKRHGISADCIGAEAKMGAMAGRERGIHIEFVFRDWQPGLLRYLVALEAATLARLLRLDPLSATWVTGVSWRFKPSQLWPQLPSGQWTTKPGLAQPPLRAGSRGSVEKLLGAGDAAFAGDRSRTPDFSPTLPMKLAR